jgi:hypothetical protein
MCDHEILKMAAFQMRSCANRILRLARQAGSHPPADQLAAIAADLLDRETHLRTLLVEGMEGGGNGDTPE